MKILLTIVGSICLALGILGIFLPLLPATPFLLLASACYLRGSTRMHRWLLTNRLFGTYLRNYEEGRGIPLKAKVMALVMLWISMSFSIYHVSIVPLKFMLLLIGIGVSIYLLKIKTLHRDAGDSRRP